MFNNTCDEVHHVIRNGILVLHAILRNTKSFIKKDGLKYIDMAQERLAEMEKAINSCPKVNK